MSTTLLTEAEVAQRLRCSVARIRKLRAAGRLAFIPGRPVLVTEGALAAYIEVEQVIRRARNPAAAAKADAAAKATAHKPPSERLGSPEVLARMIWLRRKMRHAKR